MARHTGPKTRFARRIGIALFPKDEKILTKRNFAPGMHGQGRRRLSNYGLQLLEKQKAKWMYGVMERQFRRYYERAAKKKEQTGTLLMQFLETRLDNLVFRLGFAQTRPQARQMVTHGFVEVNGKKVNIPSFAVRVGDAIGIRENRKGSKLVQTQSALLQKFKTPEWLEMNPKTLTGKLLAMPLPEQIQSLINTQSIIEHYSR